MAEIFESLSGENIDKKKEANNDLVLSYMTLRNFIGFIGFLLPIILLLTNLKSEGYKIQPSISDYYYSRNGDTIVVVLSILGVFLFTYQGYNWKEKFLTKIAGLCAIGVAFCPTNYDGATIEKLEMSKEAIKNEQTIQATNIPKANSLDSSEPIGVDLPFYDIG